MYIVFDERKRTKKKRIETINIRDASIAVLDPKVWFFLDLATSTRMGLYNIERKNVEPKRKRT